jgi:hypothetical protein
VERREQIKGWSTDDLKTVHAALRALIAPFEAELSQRWELADE